MKTVVVTIFRKKLIVCHVNPGSKKEITDVREFGWDEKTLDLVFGKIQAIYSTRKVRLLLTREVCYVLRLSVPKDLELSDKRKVILDMMLERVPDVLEDSDFDYKVVQEGDVDEEVLVFAPISDLGTPLSKAIAATHMQIEATEPEELAKTRNNNPIIGIALKEDLKGKDEEVLNLHFDQGEEQDISETTPKEKKSWKLWLTVFFTSICVGALVFYALLQFGIFSLPSNGS